MLGLRRMLWLWSHFLHWHQDFSRQILSQAAFSYLRITWNHIENRLQSKETILLYCFGNQVSLILLNLKSFPSLSLRGGGGFHSPSCSEMLDLGLWKTYQTLFPPKSLNKEIDRTLGGGKNEDNSIPSSIFCQKPSREKKIVVFASAGSYQDSQVLLWDSSLETSTGWSSGYNSSVQLIFSEFWSQTRVSPHWNLGNCT